MKKILILTVLAIISISCSEDSGEKNYLTIGIRSDAETLNPMYAFQPHEGSITELLFLSIVRHEWNAEKGILESFPMLADTLLWKDDRSKLYIKIKDGLSWSDSVKLTVDDIIFSFDVYSDPEIQSRALGFFTNYFTDETGKVIVEKSFNRISDTQLEINFRPGSHPTYFDVDQPIIPRHVFDGLSREEFVQAQFNITPVTSGPYGFESWKKNQSIVLEKNNSSFLINPESPGRIIFKVIPDYNSRLLQLQKGEIDILTDLKPEDAEELKTNNQISLGVIDGREYDYIGWNNIDPDIYKKRGIMESNKIFGSNNVRVAMTYALNRMEVLDNFLYNYGQIADAPISSIFVDAYDSLATYEYGPEKASEILKSEGWTDSDGDGIIDKDGTKFSFKMLVPSGNSRRKFAATIFSNNLKEIGIDVSVEFLEMNTFLDGLFNKEFDAWMVGWQIPIPIDLRIQWYSDPNATPVNFSSYGNPVVDSLLDALDMDVSTPERNNLLKKINEIIYNEQPYTFLYWIDNIVAYNRRIHNINVNPLGAIHSCWEWELK